MSVYSEYFYWGPLLWKTKISNDIVDGLLTRGLKSNVSHRHKLVGYFKDEYSYSKDDMSWFVEKMKPYFLKHKDVCENEWYLTENPPIQLTSLWINIMRAGDFNPPHTHDGELSFVIYLKVPEKLEEEFNSYVGRSPDGNGAGAVTFGIDFDATKKNTISTMTFLPEVGDMFIFPANLTHFVAPFKCEGERISVSGNLIKQC
jgi:uncharacterized protein (TIGR02466 family)